MRYLPDNNHLLGLLVLGLALARGSVAVPVADEQQRVWATVAVHGPAARMPIAAALARLPELKAAAEH